MHKSDRATRHFDDVIIRHEEANDLAQMASGFRFPEGVLCEKMTVGRRALQPFGDRRPMDINHVEITKSKEDWRDEIKAVLQNPSNQVWINRQKINATKYVLLDGELFKKDPSGRLLSCLDLDGVLGVMTEAHEGVCGSHSCRLNMRWSIHRNGYFWPMML